MSGPLPAKADVAERYVIFACEGEQCVGVLAQAEGTGAESVGVLIIVGGPQYRVGSHRQFTLLARALARGGVPTLRFDYRGMGDSSGVSRTFEGIEADLRAAVDALCYASAVDRVVLWGLCDGASAALMYAAGDARVRGVVAANPWARTPAIEATTRLRHYYLRRLVSHDFWAKILGGKFRAWEAAGGLSTTLRSARAAGRTAEPFLARMDRGWAAFKGDVLLILSGRDYTAQEFSAWMNRDGGRAARRRWSRARVERLAEADHTFSSKVLHDLVAAKTLAWVRSLDFR